MEGRNLGGKRGDSATPSCAIHGQGTIAKEFFLALFPNDNQGTFGALLPLSLLRGPPMLSPMFLYDVQCWLERAINHVNGQPVVFAIVKLYDPECLFGCTKGTETTMRRCGAQCVLYVRFMTVKIGSCVPTGYLNG